jgi:transposase-like protein
MSTITIEAKQMIVEKALNREGVSVAEIASKYNVGLSSLERWMKLSREGKLIETANTVHTIAIHDAKEKLEHLMATASMNEVDLGTYCRERGLYSFQLEEWKNEFMNENRIKKGTVLHSERGVDYAELKKLQAENKLLKQDIRRKDRALAETTALLVLKKKADLIWGEFEDD